MPLGQRAALDRAASGLALDPALQRQALLGGGAARAARPLARPRWCSGGAPARPGRPGSSTWSAAPASRRRWTPGWPPSGSSQQAQRRRDRRPAARAAGSTADGDVADGGQGGQGGQGLPGRGPGASSVRVRPASRAASTAARSSGTSTGSSTPAYRARASRTRDCAEPAAQPPTAEPPTAEPRTWLTTTTGVTAGNRSGQLDQPPDQALQPDRVGRPDGDDDVGLLQAHQRGAVAARRGGVVGQLLVLLQGEAAVDDGPGRQQPGQVVDPRQGRCPQLRPAAAGATMPVRTRRPGPTTGADRASCSRSSTAEVGRPRCRGQSRRLVEQSQDLGDAAAVRVGVGQDRRCGRAPPARRRA